MYIVFLFLSIGKIHILQKIIHKIHNQCVFEYTKKHRKKQWNTHNTQKIIKIIYILFIIYIIFFNIIYILCVLCVLYSKNKALLCVFEYTKNTHNTHF